MISDEMVVIRNKYTGNEFAYPKSRFSDMPTLSIENGAHGKTNFHRGDLTRMVGCGSAHIVGTAKVSLVISYDEKPE